MIGWTILAAAVCILILLAICGTCYDWGWQRGYRDGLDRGEQINRHPAFFNRGDRLRGWTPTNHCCHGIPIDVNCPACAALTARL